MTQTKQPKQKFKTGDLIKYRDKDWYLCCGIGIVYGQFNMGSISAYWVFWTKGGLDWDFEELFERVTR